MILRSFNFYNSHIRKLLSTDLHLFELSVWMQALAQALISVFIPIILYKLGLSIGAILIFYFLFNAFDVPLNLVARRFIEKYGARMAIILSIFSELGYYFILYNLNAKNWFEIVVLALLLALFDTFYWVGHVYMFAQSAHNNMSIKRDITALNIIRIIGGIIAPILGAYILIVSDQKTLIFFATLLMLASLIPIFKMQHLVFRPERKSKPFKEFFSHPYEKVNYVFEIFAAFKEEVEFVIWPFFIFFAYQSIKSVAYIPITIAVAAIITTYLTGRNIIRENIYKLVTFGALMTGLIWILRYNFYSSRPFFYLSVLFVALSAILMDLSLEVSILERGKRIDPLDASTFLNLFRMAGRGTLYLLLLVLFRFFDVFRSAFWIANVLVFVLAISSWIVALRRNRIQRLFPEPAAAEELGAEKA